MDDFVDLDELYNVHKKQDSNRLEIFREIYRKCLAKMKHTNNTLRRMECNFVVPTFVWGIPIYDYEELKDYILFHLNENGLTHCYFTDATTLYMSWRPEHIDKKKYQAAKKKLITDDLTPVSTNSVTNVTNNSNNNKGTKTLVNKSTNGNNSTMMKFDDIFEVPVNLDALRKISGTNINGNSNSNSNSNSYQAINKNQSQNQGRAPPNRQLIDSWKAYFEKRKGNV